MQSKSHWALCLSQEIVTKTFWFRTDMSTKPTELHKLTYVLKWGGVAGAKCVLGDAAGLKLILLLICDSKGPSKQKTSIKSPG